MARGRFRGGFRHDDPRDRFRRFIVNDEASGCWLWQGAVNRRGYGQFTMWLDGRWKIREAHRAAWLLFVGPLDEGRCVLHRCDNPRCVNWESHLFEGSRADNSADMVAKGRARNGRLPGEQHPMARLTWAAVREIRALGASGRRSHEIAPIYGVSSRTIREVISGSTWKESAQ